MAQAVDWTAVGSIAGLGAMVVAWLQYRSSRNNISKNADVLSNADKAAVGRVDLTYRIVKIFGDMPKYVKYQGESEDIGHIPYSFSEDVMGIKFLFDSPLKDIERPILLCWAVGEYAKIWSFRPSWKGNTSKLNVTYSAQGGIISIRIEGFPQDEELEIDILLQGGSRYAVLENQSIFVNLKKDRGNLYG